MSNQTHALAAQADVIVIGAGIVGTCTALHLQQRGLNVMLADQKAPGEGTSFGNAGLIERSSVVPYAFPRDLHLLLGYMFNRRSDVHYQWQYLPKIAPWLWQFWKNSAPQPLARAAQSMLPLIESSVREHDALLAQAGTADLISAKGWMEIYTSHTLFKKACSDLAALARYQLNIDVLSSDALHQKEPHLSDKVVGAVHYLDPKTVLDPSELTKRYAALFEQSGGHFTQTRIVSLTTSNGQWLLKTDHGVLHARQVVIAAGADATAFIDPLGYKVPLAIKRGYHVHFKAAGDAVLNHSVCESDAGFVLAPMKRGIRLTTGIEFAEDGSPANDIQIQQTEKVARSLFPLGDRIEQTPWLGRRPCLPDMCPVIGKAPHHPGLWFNFGHAHHGLTLGPVSGKLLAQMMTGETLLTDPTPYRIERFMV